MKNLNKFTIKAISMILMLTMTLSVTAMAASYAGTPTTYEDSANRNAYYNSLTDHTEGRIGREYLVDLENTTDSRWYYKLLDGYYSPLGTPTATYEYLLANFGYKASVCWLQMLAKTVSNRNTEYAKSTDVVNGYLDYLLTGSFDTDFVEMKNIYGEKAAAEFADSMTSPNAHMIENRLLTRGIYIKENTKFHEDGTYVEYKALVPLDVIAAVNAFADPLAAAMAEAIPDYNFREELYKTNLYPLDHELSVTNGRTISADEATRIAKNILASDDPDMGEFAMAGRNVVAAINTARNGKAANILEDKLVDNKNTIPTTNVTIIADGKAVTLEAVILNNTTYFKIRDLAPVMDGSVTWGDWYGTGPDGRPSGYIGTGISIYPNNTAKIIGKPAPLSPAETRDGRISIVTINTNIQLEAIVLSNEFGGATTYFKLRDVAAMLHYNVNWDAATGISVTAM